jgi:hypothetical protein
MLQQSASLSVVVELVESGAPSLSEVSLSVVSFYKQMLR